MKSLMCIPISRYKLAAAKFMVISLYFSAILILHAFLSLVIAILFGCDGITVQSFIEILFLNVRVMPPYIVTVLPIIGIVIITRKSYVIPLGVGIIITIANIVVIQSRFAAIYPWTAVMRFCGDMQGMLNIIYFDLSVWVSIISLFVCFILGLIMIISSLSKQEY